MNTTKQPHFHHVFDMTGLHESLPRAGPSAVQSPPAALAGTGWASDFILNHSQQQHAQGKGQLLGASSTATVNGNRQSPVSAGAGTSYAGYRMSPMGMSMTAPMQGQAHGQVHRPAIESDRESQCLRFVGW